MTARGCRAAHRARGPRQHPACPARGYYPDQHTAARAAGRTRGVTAQACGRCGGFHLHFTGPTTAKTSHENGAA